jgi:hypothetical protein
MLDAAAYAVLWQISDATGVRPEWLLPVLYSESGLDPSRANDAGAPYYGLNQIYGGTLQARGIDPATYLTWPASEQLQQIVWPYIAGQVSKFGPLHSATRVYQANFLPATLDSATTLNSVIASKQHDPNHFYSSNSGLDFTHSGSITVADLAHFVDRSAQTSAVQTAIAKTYALRPGERPHDVVYGDDFGIPSNEKLIIAGSIAVLAGAIAFAVNDGMLDGFMSKIARKARYVY